jgi:hypothetical protein
MKNLNTKTLFLSLGLLACTATNALFAAAQNFNQQKESIILNLRKSSSEAFGSGKNLLTPSRQAPEYESTSPVGLHQQQALALQHWQSAVNAAVNYIKIHAGNSANLQNIAGDCQILNNELVRTIRVLASPEQKKNPQEIIKTYSARMNRYATEKYNLNLRLSELNNLQKSFRTKFHDKGKIAAFAVLTELITQLNTAVNNANINFMFINPKQRIGN